MKNLRKTSLFWLLGLIYCVNSKAQIIYTDVVPDSVTVPGYDLDLDNDGTIDFAITHTFTYVTLQCGPPHPWANHYIRIVPSSGNAVACFSGFNVTKMAINTVISDATISWNNNANPQMASLFVICAIPPGGINEIPIFHNSGQWFNAIAGGYVGLKLNKNGNTYYGWLGMNLASATTITIKDYAYNSNPNQQILAGEGQTVVPLNFLAFNGMLNENKAELAWSTANEINNKGFDIERSTDGRNFIKIGFVNGKGSTSSVSKYDFTDQQLLNGINYYRLKQIDLDGKFTFSSIIKINSTSGDQQITIAPNPLFNAGTISFYIDQPEIVSIKIFDINGKLITTFADRLFEKGNQEIKLEAGKIKAGTYFLRIQSQDFSKTEKLVIIK